MPFLFEFSPLALKKFLKMDKHIQQKISTKIRELEEHQKLGSYIKPLTNFEPATHRLRVGNYRLLLEKNSETDFLILDIGDRKEIYQ